MPLCRAPLQYARGDGMHRCVGNSGRPLTWPLGMTMRHTPSVPLSLSQIVSLQAISGNIPSSIGPPGNARVMRRSGATVTGRGETQSINNASPLGQGPRTLTDGTLAGCPRAAPRLRWLTDGPGGHNASPGARGRVEGTSGPARCRAVPPTGGAASRRPPRQPVPLVRTPCPHFAAGPRASGPTCRGGAARAGPRASRLLSPLLPPRHAPPARLKPLAGGRSRAPCCRRRARALLTPPACFS